MSILLYDHATGGAGFVAQAPEHLPSLLRGARETLECARDCDRACHACLLSYDTHHNVTLLNRHRAREVLSDTFLNALDLPVDAQRFGPETRLEFEPIHVALRREMRSGDAVRLHLGGEGTRWSLRDWRLVRDLPRWTGEGRRVELVLPRGVDRIPREERILLAVWGRTHGVRLVQARYPYAKRPLLAELSSPDRTTMFAAESLDALVPGPDWGVVGEGAQVLRGYSSEPPAELEPVQPSELDAPPPGRAETLHLRDHLVGPIRTVGPSFWQAIRDASPALSQRLDTSVPIREVAYQDRYVRSPLVARILLEIFTELHKAGGVSPDSNLQILSTHPAKRASYGQDIRDDWTLAQHQKGTIERLFETASLSVAVTLRRPQRVGHARRLQVTWDDDTRWRCHFDHGFGFLRPAQSVPHPFQDPLPRQAKALANAAFDLFATAPGHAYVFGLE